MKNQKLLIFVSASAMMLAGCDAFNESYNENFDKSFKENCVKSAVAEGAPEALATKACACTIEKLQAANTDGGPLFPSEEEQVAAATECMQEMQ